MLHWATTLSLLVRPACVPSSAPLISRRPFAACYPDVQYRYRDHLTQSVTQASYASVLRRVAADDSLLTVLTKTVRGATLSGAGWRMCGGIGLCLFVHRR